MRFQTVFALLVCAIVSCDRRQNAVPTAPVSEISEIATFRDGVNHANERVGVIGTAINDGKTGAVIEFADGWWVETVGQHRWEKEIEGQTIRAVGVLQYQQNPQRGLVVDPAEVLYMRVESFSPHPVE